MHIYIYIIPFATLSIDRFYCFYQEIMENLKEKLKQKKKSANSANGSRQVCFSKFFMASLYKHIDNKIFIQNNTIFI